MERRSSCTPLPSQFNVLNRLPDVGQFILLVTEDVPPVMDCTILSTQWVLVVITAGAEDTYGQLDKQWHLKAIPLLSWTGPEGSRQSAHEGGQVVSPTHRPPLPPGNIPGTRFC